MSRAIVTVLIAPNVILREGIVSVLAATRYRILVAAYYREELCSPLPRGRQMLFILASDENAAVTSGIVAALRRDFNGARVVVLAREYDRQACAELLKSGAAAYLLSTTTADGLLKCLDLVMTGGMVVLPEAAPSLKSFPENADAGHHSNGVIAEMAASPPCDDKGRRLSDREREILRCIVNGDSNKHIGRYFEIAEASVKAGMKTILRKLGVRNRTQAAIWAASHLALDTAPRLLSENPPLAPRSNGKIVVLPLCRGRTERTPRSLSSRDETSTSARP